MKIQKINVQNFMKKVSNAKEQKKEPSQQIDNGKKKLALALGALAITSTAAIAIAAKKRKINLPNNVAETAAETIKEAENIAKEVVTYRQKSKVNGDNITKFFENGKHVKTVTSTAFPEEKKVFIVTDHLNGMIDYAIKPFKNVENGAKIELSSKDGLFCAINGKQNTPMGVIEELGKLDISPLKLTEEQIEGLKKLQEKIMQRK